MLCCALGLVWALGTGSHHLLYSTVDWQIRDAVLRDLSTAPWPVAYRNALGESWLLRAPLGFYLPAGLAGRWLGFPAAQTMLWAWTGLGLALVLALLASLAGGLDPARPRRAFAILGLTFALFHGADLLPNLWLDVNFGAGPLAGWGRGGERWDRIFQYSGHVTTLLWTPNHSLPTWLMVLLLLRHHAAPGFMRVAALPLAAGAFWTPVAAAGAALLTLAALVHCRGWWQAALSPANWIAVGFAVPLCLYLTAGATSVPHGLLTAFHPPAEALARWLLLVAVEVLAWAVPIALLLRGIGWLPGVAVLLLGLLPLYVFGPGNEMTSQGGMAPLAVLAVAAGAALLVPLSQARSRLAWFGLRVVAALALLGSLLEGSLLVTRPAWPASQECAVPQAAQQSVFEGSTNWSHYLARWPDPRLQAWLASPAPRPLPPPQEAPRCWPRGGA